MIRNRVREWPRARTPYGFWIGMLSGMSADWSGSGPTYRKWAFPEPSGKAWFAILGQVTGFMTLIGLMAVAAVLAIDGHDVLGTFVAVLLVATTILANVVAAKLP